MKLLFDSFLILEINNKFFLINECSLKDKSAKSSFIIVNSQLSIGPFFFIFIGLKNLFTKIAIMIPIMVSILLFIA